MNIKINDLYGYCEEIATILGVSVNDKFTFDLGDEKSMESLRSTFPGIDKFVKPELGQYCVVLTSPELESQLLFVFPETQDGKLNVTCFDTATTDFVDVTEGVGTEENPITLTSFNEILSDDNVIQKFNDFVYGAEDAEDGESVDDGETEIEPVTVPAEGEAPADEAPAPAPSPVEGEGEQAPVAEAIADDIVEIKEENDDDAIEVMDAVSVVGEDGEVAPADPMAAAPAPAPVDPNAAPAPAPVADPNAVAVDPTMADPNAVADPFAAQDPAMVADPMAQAPVDPMAAQAPADPNMAAPAPAPVDPAMAAPADPNAVAPAPAAPVDPNMAAAPAAPAPDPNADMAAAVAAAPDPAADPNAAPVMEEDGDDTTSEWFVLPNDDEATPTEYNVTDDETMLEGADDQSVPEGFEPISEEHEDGMVTITADGADDFVAEADNVEIELNNDDDMVIINADPAALNEADEEVPAAPVDPMGDAEVDAAIAADPAAVPDPAAEPAAPAPAPVAVDAPVAPAPAAVDAPAMDDDPTAKMKELLNYYTDYLTKLTQDPNPDIDLISATQTMIASLVKNLENAKALEETKEDAQEQAEKQARKDAKEPPKAGEDEVVKESNESDEDWIRSNFGEKVADAAKAFADEGKFTLSQIAGTDDDADLCDKAWDSFCSWCIKGKFDGEPFDPMKNMERNGKEIIKDLGRGPRLPEGALDECGTTNECGNDIVEITAECDKPGAPVGKDDDQTEIIAGECGTTNECGDIEVKECGEVEECGNAEVKECGINESDDAIEVIPSENSSVVTEIHKGEISRDGDMMRGGFYVIQKNKDEVLFDSRDEDSFFDSLKDAEDFIENELDGGTDYSDTLNDVSDDELDVMTSDELINSMADEDYHQLEEDAVDYLRNIDVDVSTGEALDYLRGFKGESGFNAWVRESSIFKKNSKVKVSESKVSSIGNDKVLKEGIDIGREGYSLLIAEAKNGRCYFIIKEDGDNTALLNSKDNGDLYDDVDSAIDGFDTYDYDEDEVFSNPEDDRISREVDSIHPAKMPELGPDGLPLAPVLTPAEEIKDDNFRDVEVEDEPIGPELGPDGLPLGSVNDVAIDNDIDAWHDEMIPMGLDADYSDDTPCASSGCCSFDDKPTFGRGISKVCWSDDFMDTLAPTSCDNTETIPSAIRELGFYVDRLMTCVDDEVSRSKLRKAKSLLNTVFTTIQSVNGALDGKCLNTDACLTDVERLERGAAAPLSHIANVEEVEFGDDAEAERLAEASIAQWCKTWKHLM